GEQGRRARAEDDQDRIERQAAVAHGTRDGAVVARALAVLPRLPGRDARKRLLGLAHPAARGADHEPHALLAPRGPHAIELARARIERPPQQPRRAVVDPRGDGRARREGPRETGSCELVVAADGDDRGLPDDAGARGLPALTER